MKRRHTTKRGIALIVVLGFLSIIVLLGVAFAIVMRTDRLATRNYLDAVRARLLMQAAIARTLENIDDNIFTGVDKWYPGWTAYGSTGTAAGIQMMTGEAVDHVPASLLADANAVDALLEWRNIDDGTKTVGRYAFLAVDCSGLLDANWIGGGARRYGVNVSELQFTNPILPEVTSAANLFASRALRIRFETLPELDELGSTDGFIGTPDRLFVYSYFPCTQYWDTAAGALANQVKISSLADITAAGASDAIKAQFAKMGIADISRQDSLYRNLVDYLDDDYVPGGGTPTFNSFCTEPVPMVSEVNIDNVVFVQPPSDPFEIEERFTVQVELWYPFLSAPPAGVTFDTKITIVPARPPAGMGFAPAPFILPSLDQVAPPAPFAPAVGDVRVVSPPQPFSIRYTAAAVPPSSWFEQFGFRISVRQQPGEIEVDRVDVVLRAADTPSPIVQLAQIPSQPADPGPASSSAQVTINKENNDPRINWDWRNDAHWDPVTGPSLGATNNKSRSDYAAPGKDGTPQMYVRNRDGLNSVGELGFLLHDALPWETIPLFGAGRLPVLDHFTTTNCVFRRGLVNPNTTDPDALATVFAGMPIGFPEMEEGTNNAAGARDLAAAFAAAIAAAGVYTNLSDLGKANVQPALNAAGFPVSAAHKFGRESVLRNSVGLLSTRQNLFTVFIAVQAVEDNNGISGIQDEDVRAEQRAVAIVWRDPFPNASGVHPSFVRFFKWLAE